MLKKILKRLLGCKGRSADQEILDWKQQFDSVFLNLPLGISYLTRDMKYVRINPYLEQKLGVVSQEVEGKYCYDVAGMYKDDASRKGADRVCDGCGVISAIRTGLPYKFTRHVNDNFVVDNIGIPIKDKSGNIVGAAEIILDITDRVRMEERLQEYAEGLEDAVEEKTRELRKSKRFLNNVIESTADAIFTLDAHSRICFMNKASCDAFGRSRDGLLERAVTELVDASDTEAIRAALCAVEDRGTTVRNLKVTALTNDGSERHHLMSMAKLSEDDDRNRYVVISKDVTKEMGLEHEKEEFLAMLTHDLKVPLTSIFGYSSMLLSGEMGEVNGEARTSVEGIQVNCQKVIDQVNDFLSVCKMASGALDMDVKPEDIEALITENLSAMQPLIRDKNINAETSFASGLPRVDIDRGHMGRVISNLLSNAVKHTPHGGSIMVGARHADDGWLTFEVSDTGMGIPEKDLPMLFDKYYQGKGASRASGSGLGLYIAKNIVEAHNGIITVSSIKGKGATFTVRLPRTG